MILNNLVQSCEAKDAANGALYFIKGYGSKIFQRIIPATDETIKLWDGKIYFTMLYCGWVYEIQPDTICYKLEDYKFEFTHIDNRK